MNISNIDLNLLVILNALCVEKSTVKAAARLSLSQPAISHALNRLREVFKDPLLVRVSRGLTPTPFLLQMEPRLRDFVESSERVFATSTSVDPVTFSGTFRIATTDYFEQLFLPKLLAALEKEAPELVLVSRPTSAILPKQELQNGDIDLAIAGFYGDLPNGFFQQSLFSDDFVCVINEKLLPTGKLTAKRYSEFRHILISPNGDMKPKSQSTLAKHGIQRNFYAGVASFLSPAWILTQTDLALTCPRRLALAYKKYFPLEIHALPTPISGITISQIWHERQNRDPLHSWMRKMIAKICQTT